MGAKNHTRLIESFSRDASFTEAFELLFENASDAIYILDKRGNFVALNRKAEELTGFKREEWIGKSFRKIVPAKSLSKAIEEFQNVTGGKSIRFELELKTAFKKTVLVEVTSKPLIINGKIVGTLGIARDITERKRMEQALRKSEEKFRNIFENANDAMIYLDRSGRILDVNRKAVEVFGGSKKELLGKHFTKVGIFSPRDLPRLMSTFTKGLAGKGVTLDIHINNKKGRQIYLECSNSLLRIDGEFIGFLVVARDITERKKTEKMLIKSGEEYKTLMDDAPIAIFNVNLKGKITYVNKRFEQDTGYSREEIADKNAFKLNIISDETMKFLKKRMKALLMGKPARSVEVQFRCKDGGWIWADMESRIIKKLGVPVGFQITGRDITERKHAEETLKKSEEKLSALNICSRRLNMAKNMEEIYQLTLDAMEKTLGFEHAFFMVVDKDMLCIVDQRGYPVDLSIRLPLDGSKRGVSVKVASTGKPINIPDAQKEDAWVEFWPGIRSGLDVPVKIGRKVLGVIGVDSKSLNAFDGKDQKLLEILASHAATAISNLEHAKNLEAYAQEIRESQQKFERLFMDNPESAVYLDPHFHILDVNPRFSELFGYSLDEVKGKHINSAIVPKDKMEEAEMLGRRFMKGYVYYDTIRQRKDGSLVPVSISAAPIIVKGRLTGYVGLYKDVTERKQMERKLQEYSEHLEELVEKRTRQLKETQEQLLKSERLAAIGEMAAMVGHDLRNPLTGIAGATYYLKTKLESEMDKTAKDMVELIEKGIKYSDKIISELLEYSREIHLELAGTTPKSIMKDALTLVKVPKNIRILNLTENKPKIKIDVQKMERALVNIIKNAIDAMPEGGKLTVTSKKTNNKLEIAFTDTGIGIPNDTLEKIWTPLFTTKAKGIGLGIPICKRIVEAHGGKISAKSTVGKGTTFTVTIPVKPESEGGEKVWVNVPESLLLTTTKA
jgi:PAS domain S-box-containing protein